MRIADGFRALALVALFASPAGAKPAYLDYWKMRYSGTTLPERVEKSTGSACTVCHPLSGFRWDEPGNAYREMLHAMLHAGKRSVQEAIEAADSMDSDGDGVPNGMEILAPRPDGGVGYHPGLVGEQGIDPTSASGDQVITRSPETPLFSNAILIEPPVLDFGTLPIGTVSTRYVTVRNRSLEAHTVTGMSMPLGAMVGYSVQSLPAYPVTLAPGASFSLGVRYVGTSPGYFYRSLGWIELTCDRRDEFVHTLLLRGRGAVSPGAFFFSPFSLQFGVIPASGSSTLPITFTNTTEAPVTISNPRVDGEGAAFFRAEWDSSPPRTVKPGTAATVHFTFLPLGERLAAASLQVDTDLAGETGITIALRGEGRSLVTPGDANLDGALDISDAVKILIELFAAPATTCLDALDATDDGKTDISDAVYLLRHLFLAGPGPEACVLDTSARYLGCPEGSTCEG